MEAHLVLGLQLNLVVVNVSILSINYIQFKNMLLQDLEPCPTTGLELIPVGVNKYYQRQAATHNYPDADRFCRVRGMHLATIDSKDTLDIYFNYKGKSFKPLTVI